MRMVLIFLALAWPAAALEFAKEDRVCVVGSGLAVNLEQDGWLETLLQVRFPERQLSFRNLGQRGEILDLRLEDERLTHLDRWLTRLRPDVILAFYGTNESYGGAAGLAAFSQKLDTFLLHLLSKPYNGEQPPRIVLFSPLGYAPKADFNPRLAPYVQAMSEAARRRGVEFVDLFTVTKDFTPPLSDDGAELSEQGRAIVSGLIDRALFGEAPARPEAVYARVQQAVVTKDHFWKEQYAAFRDQPETRMTKDAVREGDFLIWQAAADSK